MRTCQRHDLTHVFLAVVALLFLLAFHTSSAKAMGGATPEDIVNFEELMDVRWLTCTFEAIETSSEEILYGITFDPDVNAARLTTLPKEDPTHQDLSPIDHFTIVFNSAKTKAHLLWAPRGDQSNEETVDEEVANIYTQPPVWEMGFMQVLIQFPADFGPPIRTTVSIFASRMVGAFVAFQTVAYDLSILVFEGRCVPQVSSELMGVAKSIRTGLDRN